MIYLLITFLVLLAGLSLFSLLLAFRRNAVLRRVHAGVLALLQGREPPPLERSPEDVEDILSSFDQLVAMLAEQKRDLEIEAKPRDMEVVLERMIAVLRQPLVAIQSYAALLGQAPDVPSVGDTRELVDKLVGQINGLMRLVESSSDMSQLREGLERELAMAMPGKPTPVVLMIDEENPWSLRVTEALRSYRLQTLIAPGADAAVIMARAVRPRALLVNVGRADGLGWKALPALKRDRGMLHAPVIAYRLAGDGRRGALWTPEDVWFWPLPNNDDSRVVRNSIKSDNLRYALHGDLELATEVSRWLAAGGILIEPTETPPPLLIDGCVTVVLSDASGATTENDDFVLVVPQRLIPEEVDRLVRSIERQAERSTVSLDELEVTMLQSVRPIAESLVNAEINA